MRPLDDDVVGVLGRYMPQILAQSVRRRAQSAAGVPDGNLRAEHLPALLRQLESGIRLFVEPAFQDTLLSELQALAGDEAPALESVTIAIELEAHISVARTKTRELALALGAGVFAAQRAATVASELTRNIVAYAGTGQLDLEPRNPAHLLLRAIDEGPGIQDLEAVLSGDYRSKTGLGKGLQGVARLATRFDVDTGPKGTRVEVELAL